MSKSEYTFIYELADPRTNRVRYVGKADNPLIRLRNHFANSRHESDPKALWMQELRQLGLKPKLSIFAKVSRDDWKVYERGLIQYHRESGADLLNIHKGGGGGPEWDEERRELYRQITKSNWDNPEYREKVTLAIRQNREDPEFIESLRNQTTELWQDPEYREKVRSAIKQSWEDSPDRKEAIAQKWSELQDDEEFMKRFREGVLQGWDSPERRQNQSEWAKELWNSPGHREKISEIMSRVYQSPEYREGLSERAQARWDNPEKRKKWTEAIKKSRTPEQAEETRKRNRQLWDDPEHRAKRVEAMRKAGELKRKKRLEGNV